MGILISWDNLGSAAPIYDRRPKTPQPVFDWDKERWIHKRSIRRTAAPSLIRDTWKQLAAAVADGYLELIKKYSEGEMLISSGHNGTHPYAALTFFPKGQMLTLKEIREIPEEGLGNVPDWFSPVRKLDKGMAAVLAAMES